ncbi:MAG: DUF58 domain-containing protein [Planctomycetota bacterium]|jgi:uncharacterized protein (DUF58 family)
MKREIVFDQTFLESLRRIQLLARESSGGRLDGARVSRAQGSGVEPADWRPYLPGDSPRDVDWRAFARLGRLFVRLRAREESSNVYLLVDSSASMGLGRPAKFTFARRVAGALAAAALSGLDAVAVGLLRGDECDPGGRLTGADRLPEVIRTLEDARAGGETDVAAGLARFLDHSPERGVIVVLSDFWSEGDVAPSLVAAAELGFEGSLVQVLAPEEVEPSHAGRERLVDSESGAELEMRLSPAAREAYVEERERHFEELGAAASRAGFRSVALRTDTRLEDAVLVDLRRAGVVG